MSPNTPNCGRQQVHCRLKAVASLGLTIGISLDCGVMHHSVDVVRGHARFDHPTSFVEDFAANLSNGPSHAAIVRPEASRLAAPDAQFIHKRGAARRLLR